MVRGPAFDRQRGQRILRNEAALSVVATAMATCMRRTWDALRMCMRPLLRSASSARAGCGLTTSTAMHHKHEAQAAISPRHKPTAMKAMARPCRPQACAG